jgi:hypothetical protein
MNASDRPPTSIRPPERAHSDVAHEREAAREELFGGARLLVGDARVVYLLLNDARARGITRLFGISGPNSALVTLIALGLAAETAHRKVSRVLKAPGTPDFGGLTLGTSALSESARWITGPGIGDFPFFGPLIVFAVVGHAAPGSALGGPRRQDLRAPSTHRSRSSIRAHHPSQPATPRATQLTDA